MKLNYIILAHRGPLQVLKLIDKLSEAWTYFYIHIDSNINITPFKQALKDHENIIFLEGNERYAGIWGDIGIVKGTLAAMNRIAAKKEKCYTILLSGQDYPLQGNRDILNFFKDNNTNYIDINPVSELWGKHGIDRVKKYKVNKSSKRGHFLMLPTVFDKDFYRIETLGKLNFLRKSGNSDKIFQIFKKRKFKGLSENLWR